MRRLLYCLLLINCFSTRLYAQAKTEEIQVGRLLACLQHQDNTLYQTIFPSFDTLYMLAMQYNDDDVEGMKRLANLRANPEKLRQFDPMYNPAMVAEFDSVLRKGSDSGLHWRDMVMAKYELTKMPLPRELVGLSKIMPLRMEGYVFVEDMLTRRRYILAVKDICTIRGRWFGGRVLNIFEAETIDEYLKKLAIEKRVMKERLWRKMQGIPEDTIAVVADGKPSMAIGDDDGEDTIKRDVVERKYYQGMFDNETPVEMYIRGMKGGCPETICSWQAIYRYQDMDEYIKLIVSRAADGSWIFNEDPEVGAMELKLEGNKFTGTWMSLKDKTEYEVEFTEQPEVKGRKLYEMDDVIENEAYAH